MKRIRNWHAAAGTAWTFAVLLVFGSESARAESVAIQTQSLPWAISGVQYRAPISIRTGGRCPTEDAGLILVGGALPEGIELFGFGLQGTTHQSGHFQFTVRASTACSHDTRKLELIVTGRPVLMTNVQKLSLRHQAGNAATQEQTVLLESTWPSLPYSVVASDAPWLRVDRRNGVTPESGSSLEGDRVRLQIDPTTLAPGSYSAQVSFYGHNAANPATVEVTLVVEEPKRPDITF